jgi:MioC protein
LFKNQKHDYRCLHSGIDYVFEPINTGIKGYMTGVGEGVKSGDWIILEYQKQTFSYQVKEIDYYSSPANMWTALLQVIS